MRTARALSFLQPLCTAGSGGALQTATCLAGECTLPSLHKLRGTIMAAVVDLPHLCAFLAYSCLNVQLVDDADAGVVQAAGKQGQPASPCQREHGGARFAPLPEWYKAQCRSFAASALPRELRPGRASKCTTSRFVLTSEAANCMRGRSATAVQCCSLCPEDNDDTQTHNNCCSIRKMMWNQHLNICPESPSLNHRLAAPAAQKQPCTVGVILTPATAPGDAEEESDDPLDLDGGNNNVRTPARPPPPTPFMDETEHVEEGPIALYRKGRLESLYRPVRQHCRVCHAVAHARILT